MLFRSVLQRLMLLAESLTSLLFPFRWQHVYVPILPYSQFMFLEAPLPFVMGLWIEDNIPEEVVQVALVFASYFFVNESKTTISQNCFCF